MSKRRRLVHGVLAFFVADSKVELRSMLLNRKRELQRADTMLVYENGPDSILVSFATFAS